MHISLVHELIRQQSPHLAMAIEGKRSAGRCCWMIEASCYN